MHSDLQSIEAITEQVKALQRQILWLKSCVGFAIGGLILAFALGQTPLQTQSSTLKVLEAEKFVLKDSKGRTRGEWEVEELPRFQWDKVSFKLLDSEGKVAAVLQNPSWANARLVLIDRSKKESSFATDQEKSEAWTAWFRELEAGIGMVGIQHTEIDANSVFIAGKDLSQSLSIEMLEKPSISIHSGELQTRLDAAQLTLNSTNGRVSLSAEPQPMMVLSAKGEKRNVLFSQFEDAFLLAVQVGDHFRARWDVGKTFNSISLFDEGGKKRAVLGSTELTNIATGESYSRKESSLVLFGEDGKVVFSEP